jgi:hypothetical protein
MSNRPSRFSRSAAARSAECVHPIGQAQLTRCQKPAKAKWIIGWNALRFSTYFGTLATHRGVPLMIDRRRSRHILWLLKAVIAYVRILFLTPVPGSATPCGDVHLTPSPRPRGTSHRHPEGAGVAEGRKLAGGHRGFAVPGAAHSTVRGPRRSDGADQGRRIPAPALHTVPATHRSQAPATAQVLWKIRLAACGDARGGRSLRAAGHSGDGGLGGSRSDPADPGPVQARRASGGSGQHPTTVVVGHAARAPRLRSAAPHAGRDAGGD